ncbi:type VI secretion system protein TssA [Pelomonas sp. KK5]|uniref:type VI secretion system protein TssA n=1 Tax=Pelomonas sp. KK5 TaxID=1855730 RepID=UPI00097C1C64|nr:type VI secretion system protein TssA [Pelomonas sp. KK5]
METLAIDAWLEPLAGETCGPDLEYDPDFMTLDAASKGKEADQFGGAAEPPQWPMVREVTEGLMGRTRDLRVAMYWARAVLNLEGVEALPAVLRLLGGLLDRFWDGLHPVNDPDDGSPFARLSVLGSLDSLSGLLGDVRQVHLIKDRRLGGMTVREIEIALEKLGPRADEVARTPGQLMGTLGEYPDLTERARAWVSGSADALKALQTVMNDRFGIGQGVDVKALRDMIDAVRQMLPEEGAEGAASAGDEADTGGDGGSGGDGVAAAPRRRGGGPGSIESRADAVKAINLICAYLERHEPSNPAQLLLRRAEKLIDMNFMQLVYQLAPDGLSQVAKVMGLNARDFEIDE